MAGALWGIDVTLVMEQHRKQFRCETREEVSELLTREPWEEVSVVRVTWPAVDYFRVELTTTVFQAPTVFKDMLPDAPTKLPEESSTE